REPDQQGARVPRRVPRPARRALAPVHRRHAPRGGTGARVRDPRGPAPPHVHHPERDQPGGEDARRRRGRGGRAGGVRGRAHHDPGGLSVQRVTTRNAAFQQWEALLTNRTKRHRAGEMVVQGVRPITLAVESGWTVRTWLVDADRSLSSWAHAMLDRVRAKRYAVSTDLMRELGGKEAEAPELLAVVATPPDDLRRIGGGTVGADFLGVVLDRPTSPGNVGTVARSLDAFGGAGLVVAGHAADPYDP